MYRRAKPPISVNCFTNQQYDFTNTENFFRKCVFLGTSVTILLRNISVPDTQHTLHPFICHDKIMFIKLLHLGYMVHWNHLRVTNWLCLTNFDIFRMFLLFRCREKWTLNMSQSDFNPKMRLLGHSLQWPTTIVYH